MHCFVHLPLDIRPTKPYFGHMQNGNAQNGATLASVIKAARGARGVSQAALAASVGVTTPFICDIENGRRESASPRVLLLLAAQLGINRRKLLRIGASKHVQEWLAAHVEAGRR